MGGISSTEMASKHAILSVTAPAKHTATVIFLHGLGDTGHGWCQTFNDIRKSHIKYIFPTAPVMPVTLNNGFKMPSWFDIQGLSPDSPEDEAGIKKAASTLQSMIEEEEKLGIPRERIVIGGFSQGGAVAMFSSMTCEKRVAGVIALSTWMPLHKKVMQNIKASPDLHILQGHGTSDPVVPLIWGQKTGELLKALNFKNHQMKTYQGMMHSSCAQEMEDIAKFLNELLPQD